MDIISTPIDFVGLNIYTGMKVEDAPDLPETVRISTVDRSKMTHYGWPVVPESIYDVVERYSERYGIEKIYITENGASYDDVVSSEERVHDPERICFLSSYILEVERAVSDGFPVKGYFVWSLLDNFEWNSGYDQRFGITYVDYANGQRRIPKDSYYYYRDLIKICKQQNGGKQHDTIAKDS